MESVPELEGGFISLCLDQRQSRQMLLLWMKYQATAKPIDQWWAIKDTGKMSGNRDELWQQHTLTWSKYLLQGSLSNHWSQPIFIWHMIHNTRNTCKIEHSNCSRFSITWKAQNKRVNATVCSKQETQVYVKYILITTFNTTYSLTLRLTHW